jgi:hypothetical protein
MAQCLHHLGVLLHEVQVFVVVGDGLGGVGLGRAVVRLGELVRLLLYAHQ